IEIYHGLLATAVYVKLGAGHVNRDIVRIDQERKSIQMLYFKKGFPFQIYNPFTFIFPFPSPGQRGITVKLDYRFVRQLDRHLLSKTGGIYVEGTIHPSDQEKKSNQQN